MSYLVDTDVLVDVSRNNQAAINFLDQLDDSWSMSIITALELIVGARNKREVTQIDQLVAVYDRQTEEKECALPRPDVWAAVCCDWHRGR
jgi:predicted nucleic acid-binding protein